MRNYSKYIGIDAHKKYCYVNVQDRRGNIIDEARVSTDKESLQAYFSRFNNENVISTLESTYNWMFVYEILEKNLTNVKLANPRQTKAISAAKVKTDKVDAKTLSNLLRADLIPEIYVSNREERRMKDILRHRHTLIQTRTRYKNKIHAYTARKGFVCPYSDLFGKMGKAYLLKQDWGDALKQIIKDYLQLIESLNTKISEKDKYIEKEVKTTKRLLLLTSIPGIGKILAYSILSEIGTIKRFVDIKNFVSYCGLVPGIHQSSDKTYYKRSKSRNKYMQWSFIEAAIPATRTSYILLNTYRRIKRRTNNNKKAKMTVARKLAEAVYKVLTKEVPYVEGVTIRKSTPC